MLCDSVSDTLHSLSVFVPSDLSFPSHCGTLLETLSPVTFDEVGRILSRSPAKSSSMDIIPTSLVLRCKPVFCEIIDYLANLSFSEGRIHFRYVLAISLVRMRRNSVNSASGVKTTLTIVFSDNDFL